MKAAGGSGANALQPQH